LKSGLHAYCENLQVITSCKFFKWLRRNLPCSVCSSYTFPKKRQLSF